MPKKKKTDAAMSSSKTNALNDGVKNTAQQQNTGARLNMPRGAKKPENTPK